MITCPRCSQENPEGASFCNACAAPLAPAAETLLEERKVVTVLFADLVGFTSRAEQMDPEEVRSLLRPYHARLRDELERFGGTVEKFIGDAVMAVFGAPVAHEDDAERAVRAALAIRDWILDEQAELQLRIGVNTGQALVSLGARPEEGEGMVAGDVVNTAARLQSNAPVNGILVGETTWRATRDTIDYREAEAVEAKGKAEPVEAWEAVEALARVGVDISGRVRTPLVGRRRELDTLLDAFERAKSTRQVQLVTLVGEPGIGKSRLVYELFQTVEHDPELIYWRQGRSLPYGEGISFWALGEMVKAHAGILETDAKDEAERKLRSTVEAALPDEDVGWTLSHLRPLAGIEDIAGRNERQEEAFAAWRGFLEGIADESPLVLVFEDLHWADEGLLDFVDHLVDWATRVPLLVVGTARSELLTRRPAWGGGKTNALTLSLAPLSGVETAELVHGLLEQAAIPADIQATLLERAGGNPLYAEEFVRLLDERANGAALPETVQGIIAARLDVLDPRGEGVAAGRCRSRSHVLGRRARSGAGGGRSRRSIASSDGNSSSASAGAPSPARLSTRSGMLSSARSRTSRFPGPSEGRSTAGSPTGSKNSAGPTILPSSSRITTSRCSTTRSPTASSPNALPPPWARREIERSRSTRTEPLPASTAAHSTSAAAGSRAVPLRARQRTHGARGCRGCRSSRRGVGDPPRGR